MKLKYKEMKRIILTSMFVISLMATAQLSQRNYLDLTDTLISTLNSDLLIENLPSTTIEEEDTPFDFNTKDYLPLGFNPYAKKQNLDIIEVSIEEEDAPFDFDIKEYLPLGFNPYNKNLISTISEESVEEEDTPFDFNTKEYLPEDFNPYKGLKKSTICSL